MRESRGGGANKITNYHFVFPMLHANMCVLSQTTSHDMIPVLSGWGWDRGGVARPYKRISLVQSINVNV